MSEYDRIWSRINYLHQVGLCAAFNGNIVVLLWTVRETKKYQYRLVTV